MIVHTVKAIVLIVDEVICEGEVETQVVEDVIIMVLEDRCMVVEVTMMVAIAAVEVVEEDDKIICLVDVADALVEAEAETTMVVNRDNIK